MGLCCSPVSTSIFKAFYYINLDKAMSPKDVSIFETTELHLNKPESPGPKDVPCQTITHFGQWFMRRRYSYRFLLDKQK